MALQNKTIDDFCRLCAIESESGVIIYSAEGENLCLEEKIISCLRIEVSRDDLLPKKVCQLCSELLEDYHRFSERAVQVQQTLGLLLGIHAPHPNGMHAPSEEMPLCLMQTNVKVESNVIKNELDELAIHHGNIQLEGDLFDLSLGMQVSNEYQDEEARKKLVIEGFERDTFVGGEECNYVNGDNMLVDNVRQMHRRKMAQPKKAASCEEEIHDELDRHNGLAQHVEMECLINNSNENQTDFKSEAFNDCEFFQDGEENENRDESVSFSDAEAEQEDEIEKEWRKHWGILCNQCRNSFPTKAVFDKHYTFYYNKKPVYTCSYCKITFDKYTHYRSHCLNHIYEGQFKCEFCEKKFCMEEMLQVHMNTHNVRKGSYICEECGLDFSSQKRLNSHKKKHNNQTPREFRCPECGKVLQTRGGLTAHLTVHKLGRRFMCHLCGKTFTQKINMQQHVKHHKGEKPYSCEDCGKAFTEKSHLNRHKSFHTLDRPFQCSVCKKMYKTERCLKVHSHVHLNTRPYVCSYCGKGFLSSTKLKQHYNCHTGERPFACKYCERTFTNYPNWLKHTRRRHKVDHKTGLSLKEESQTRNVHAPTAVAPTNGDDGDSVQILVSDTRQTEQIITQPITSHYQDSPNELSHFHIHSVSELVDDENMYPVHVTPSFRLGFKEI